MRSPGGCLAATASVLQMARQLQTAQQHIEAYPSVAEDAQTNPLRKAVHLLQRTVNSLHGTMEISDQQAALTCLGHAADIYTCYQPLHQKAFPAPVVSVKVFIKFCGRLAGGPVRRFFHILISRNLP